LNFAATDYDNHERKKVMSESLHYDVPIDNDFSFGERELLFSSLRKFFGSPKGHDQIAEHIIFDQQAEDLYSVSPDPIARLRFETYIEAYMDCLEDVDTSNSDDAE
jgi:hypothetical protein